MILAHVWDPYHGDPNNRHQRLGALRPRRVKPELFYSYALVQPAIHNNGIFGWLPHLDCVAFAQQRFGTQLTYAAKHKDGRARRRAIERQKEIMQIIAEAERTFIEEEAA